MARATIHCQACGHVREVRLDGRGSLVSDPLKWERECMGCALIAVQAVEVVVPSDDADDENELEGALEDRRLGDA